MSRKELDNAKDCLKYKDFLKEEIQERYSELMEKLKHDEEFLALLKSERIVTYKEGTNIVIYYDEGIATGQISAANSMLYPCPFDIREKAITLDFFNSKKI